MKDIEKLCSKFDGKLNEKVNGLWFLVFCSACCITSLWKYVPLFTTSWYFMKYFTDTSKATWEHKKLKVVTMNLDKFEKVRGFQNEGAKRPCIPAFTRSRHVECGYRNSRRTGYLATLGKGEAGRDDGFLEIAYKNNKTTSLSLETKHVVCYYKPRCPRA